jgi:hypothetical protein
MTDVGLHRAPFDKETIGIGGQTLRERLIMNEFLDSGAT